ncbi:hypothetical protein [Halococcus sp. PRR34]|uniref:hypothetical protein n=1 Tax=Halococcus sp. PRR34 TaxID=3020830 RepID=UPI002360CB31|nr:hypothetical protein [Halococcus sp. PRR34]
MTDDELESRKEETWGMSEVRGDSLEQEDAAINPPEEGSSDTADLVDTADTAEVEAETDAASDIAADKTGKTKSDTTDVADTAQSENPENTSDTPDTVDPGAAADQSVSQDTADTADADVSSTTKERPEGATVRQMARDAEAKEFTVRDLRNVNVYLYDDIHKEMVSTFKALDSEYYQKHGEDLSKNKDFFNAVFRAGLSSPRLRKELELRKE